MSAERFGIEEERAAKQPYFRMALKLTKSRSVVLKKGREADKFRFSITGTPILTISGKPIQSLGMFFDSSHRDPASIKNTCEKLEGCRQDVPSRKIQGMG